MLIEFSVSNFLSFNDRQTFSMQSGNVRLKMNHVSRSRKCNLLKFVAVYGANGAGKSNLVTAMKFARRVICDGLKSGDRSKYCRIHPENSDRNTTFEFQLKIGNKMYAYGFEVLLSKESIRKEWLSEIQANGEMKELFVREPAEKISRLESVLARNASIKVFAESMASNDTVLFLTEMSRNKSDFFESNVNLQFLQSLYTWFKETLSINYPNTISTSDNFTESEKLQEINKFISRLDLGLSGVRLVECSLDELHQHMPPKIAEELLERFKKDIAEILKQYPNFSGGVVLHSPRDFFLLSYDGDTKEIQLKKLEFIHNNIETTFEYHEESDGTLRLLDLVDILISAKFGSKRVYVIDEIDRCLHPLLTRKFVEEYLNVVENTEIQLIVTTHESKLMDLSLLRADEIRFVTKDEYGSSEFDTLDKYNERFDKKVVKAYLNGEYNGIPKFDKSA